MSPLTMMKESLDLTEDQVQQLEPIMAQQQRELSAFRRDTSLSRQDRVVRLKTMQQTNEAQLKSILTEEQMEKWRNHELRGSPN